VRQVQIHKGEKFSGKIREILDGFKE